MSFTGAASSTIDMLPLEYPRNIGNIYNDTYPENVSVEIREPASWLRQLAHQRQLAQTDLQRLHHICGGELIRMTTASVRPSEVTKLCSKAYNTYTSRQKQTSEPHTNGCKPN